MVHSKICNTATTSALRNSLAQHEGALPCTECYKGHKAGVNHCGQCHRFVFDVKESPTCHRWVSLVSWYPVWLRIERAERWFASLVFRCPSCARIRVWFAYESSMGRKPTLTPGLTISRWCAGRNERTRPSRMIVPLERASLTDGSGELERNP